MIMEMISGESNWRLLIRREPGEIAILRAVTCDRRAALPQQLFGLPVTALGDHALAPGSGTAAADGVPAGAEEVLITCGVPEADWDNRRLQDLSLPASLRQVGNYALLNCSGLRTLRLHDDILHWGGGALMNCRLLDTFSLTRTGPEQGPALAYLAGELSRELDVTIAEADGGTIRLLFPEYTEIYEENCPAHHFDYNISGAGYPYHHCFRQKKLRLNEYDALWPGFLGMEHEKEAALRLAWRRLRWPAELGQRAEQAYLAYLRAHTADALRLLVREGDGEGLGFLLERTEPDRETLSAACAQAREAGASSLLALLLEERHRRFPTAATRTFDL